MNANPSGIAAAIVDAPAWALIGLTMPDEQTRERGAEKLARWIVERIEGQPVHEGRQGCLSLWGRRSSAELLAQLQANHAS